MQEFCARTLLRLYLLYFFLKARHNGCLILSEEKNYCHSNYIRGCVDLVVISDDVLKTIKAATRPLISTSYRQKDTGMKFFLLSSLSVGHPGLNRVGV